MSGRNGGGRVRGPDGHAAAAVVHYLKLVDRRTPGAGVWLAFALVAVQRPKGVIGLLYVQVSLLGLVR
jgi:hypothetical protein